MLEVHALDAFHGKVQVLRGVSFEARARLAMASIVVLTNPFSARTA